MRFLRIRGRVECWGSEADSIEVREKGIPVLIRAVEESCVEVWAPSRPLEIEEIIPKEWDELASSIGDGETVMLLGGVDVGKSGLFTFLANRLVSRGMKVALIDADVGQSDIGPVGTIGLGIIESPIIHPSLLKPHRLFFVGDNTPRGHLLPMVVGVKKLLEEAKLERVNATIINTTGYIHSGPARALKRFKISVTEPSKVVILQREGESEHIAKLVPNSSELIRMSVAKGVRRKNRTFREIFRQSNIRRYLNGAKKLRVNLKEVRLLETLFLTGKPSQELKLQLEKLLKKPVLYAEEAPDAIICLLESNHQKSLMLRGKPVRIGVRSGYRGLYVGFLDGRGFCRGVGIIEEFRPEEGLLEVYTNFLGEFNFIEFGHLKFNKDGVQVGRRGVREP